jgi:hypothetical protein
MMKHHPQKMLPIERWKVPFQPGSIPEHSGNAGFFRKGISVTTINASGYVSCFVTLDQGGRLERDPEEPSGALSRRQVA